MYRYFNIHVQPHKAMNWLMFSYIILLYNYTMAGACVPNFLLPPLDTKSEKSPAHL